MIPPDWLYGLAGGLLIGTAAAMFLLLNGRIMGASGLLGGLVDGTGRTAERVVFVAALIAAPALVAFSVGASPTNATSDPFLLVLAGLAVGYGTRLANGCTSGHGVCGISRLSRRGIGATLVYLGTGGLTMLVARHVLEVI